MKSPTGPYDVIVIGGGASGMMAAGRAGQRGKRVLLFEKNGKLGAKLSISGGGRCNILNAEEDEHLLLKQYGKAGPFLYSSFSQFGMQEAYDFFESRGLPLKIEARKRVFPVSDKAGDVVRLLGQYLVEGRVEVRTRARVERIVASQGRIEQVIVNGEAYSAANFILATGGFSHPETGSTGDGFSWLRDIGYTIEEPTPTIVPLKTEEAWSKKLAGISIPESKITFFVDGVRNFSAKGTILFTHFGLSGPLILNAARKVADLLQAGVVTAQIDTDPATDLGILDKKIATLFDANKNKSLKNAFRGIAPAGTAEVLLSLVPQIDPEGKVHSVTKENRRALALLLKHIPLSITGLMGFDRAVVADGGLPLTELDTKTMRAKKYENLFVTGDLLHITRPSGGYSLQLCWTSGFVAGSHAK